jgi:hypothetical protein
MFSTFLGVAFPPLIMVCVRCLTLGESGLITISCRATVSAALVASVHTVTLLLLPILQRHVQLCELYPSASVERANELRATTQHMALYSHVSYANYACDFQVLPTIVL